MNESRDESGQFTSPEPATGIAAVEESQGYKSMPAPAEPEIAEQSIEEAVANQQAGRAAAEPSQDIIEVGYQKDGERVDPKETVTLERAADDMGSYHTAMNTVAETHVNADFKAAVDRVRAEALKANPNLAEDLGLSGEDIDGAIQAMVPPEATPEPVTKAQEAPDPYADAKISERAKAVLNEEPEFREYLEQRDAAAHQAIETFKASVNQNQQVAQATLAALAPQLQSIPLEHWAGAILQIAQTDPVRGKLVVDTLSNWNAIQQRAELVQHYEQSQRQDRFESYVKGEDARTKELAKKEGITVDYQKIYSSWERMGVPRNQLAQFYRDNPGAASAEGQITQMKAALYDEMMQAPKARPTRELPPVARPGTAPAAARGDASQIRALERQLETATGHRAARLGAKLLAAKRSA